jgi:hypothetical protein
VDADSQLSDFDEWVNGCARNVYDLPSHLFSFFTMGCPSSLTPNNPLTRSLQSGLRNSTQHVKGILKPTQPEKL